MTLRTHLFKEIVDPGYHRGRSFHLAYCYRKFREEDAYLTWDPERTTCRVCLSNYAVVQESHPVVDLPSTSSSALPRLRLLQGGKEEKGS